MAKVYSFSWLRKIASKNSKKKDDKYFQYSGKLLSKDGIITNNLEGISKMKSFKIL